MSIPVQSAGYDTVIKDLKKLFDKKSEDNEEQSPPYIPEVETWGSSFLHWLSL